MAARKSREPSPDLDHKQSDSRYGDLRRRAEEALKAKAPEFELPHDAKKLIQELHVHQVELEMQNEELREAQEKLQDAIAKYFDLYEFAPVGYLTLDKSGIISKINMTLAHMLGVKKGSLINYSLMHFIMPEDRPLFASHLRKVFSTDSRHRAEVRIRREKRRGHQCGSAQHRR